MLAGTAAAAGDRRETATMTNSRSAKIEASATNNASRTNGRRRRRYEEDGDDDQLADERQKRRAVVRELPAEQSVDRGGEERGDDSRHPHVEHPEVGVVEEEPGVEGGDADDGGHEQREKQARRPVRGPEDEPRQRRQLPLRSGHRRIEGRSGG